MGARKSRGQAGNDGEVFYYPVRSLMQNKLSSFWVTTKRKPSAEGKEGKGKSDYTDGEDKN